MSAKLSIAEKKEITRLYCETDLSTNQLAQQYGTSSSTILRLLKEMLTLKGYKQVVNQKQARAKQLLKTSLISEDAQSINQLDLGLAAENDQLSDRNIGSEDLEVFDGQQAIAEINPESQIYNLELGSPPITNAETDEEVINLDPLNSNLSADEDFDLISAAEQQVVDRLTGEHISDDLVIELVDEEIVDDEFEDDDEDEEDDEDEIEDSGLDESLTTPKVDNAVLLFVLPLAQAKLPHTCYIVVDKISEIVTRPLRDFKDLGKIPVEEMQVLTMPLFDNHKIARRFSAHNQKVIKFPAKLITITQKNLAKKGITRLLFNGQIYAL